MCSASLHRRMSETPKAALRSPWLRRIYELSLHLHRLPYELADAPQHQVMLALALLELQAEEAPYRARGDRTPAEALSAEDAIRQRILGE